MIKTYGLTHISLAVRDPDQSLRFYERVFGVREVFRDETSVQAQTPGSQDLIAFEKNSGSAGVKGGIAHFGFRLHDPRDIDAAVREVEQAGGKALRRGEHAPGSPAAYVSDPDGFEIEIWYE